MKLLINIIYTFLLVLLMIVYIPIALIVMFVSGKDLDDSINAVLDVGTKLLEFEKI